jgi:hypothetical protein
VAEHLAEVIARDVLAPQEIEAAGRTPRVT